MICWGFTYMPFMFPVIYWRIEAKLTLNKHDWQYVDITLFSMTENIAYKSVIPLSVIFFL